MVYRGVQPLRHGRVHRVLSLARGRALICVNKGTGTMDGAQAWVEYCNGTGDTYWANLRRENGHEEPYNVRYWGLGNEMYGEWQIGGSFGRKLRE